MKTLVVVIGIIVVAIIVQWSRFYSKVKSLKTGECAVLPINYIPFNGTYCIREI